MEAWKGEGSHEKRGGGQKKKLFLFLVRRPRPGGAKGVSEKRGKEGTKDVLIIGRPEDGGKEGKEKRNYGGLES